MEVMTHGMVATLRMAITATRHQVMDRMQALQCMAILLSRAPINPAGSTTSKVAGSTAAHLIIPSLRQRVMLRPVLLSVAGLLREAGGGIL